MPWGGGTARPPSASQWLSRLRINHAAPALRHAAVFGPCVLGNYLPTSFGNLGASPAAGFPAGPCRDGDPGIMSPKSCFLTQPPPNPCSKGTQGSGHTAFPGQRDGTSSLTLPESPALQPLILNLQPRPWNAKSQPHLLAASRYFPVLPPPPVKLPGLPQPLLQGDLGTQPSAPPSRGAGFLPAVLQKCPRIPTHRSRPIQLAFGDDFRTPPLGNSGARASSPRPPWRHR